MDSYYLSTIIGEICSLSFQIQAWSSNLSLHDIEAHQIVSRKRKILQDIHEQLEIEG